MNEETGGFFIPGTVTVCEPIWDNWFGRLLKRRFGVYRKHEENLVESLLGGLKEETVMKTPSFTGNVWFVHPKGKDSNDGKTPKTAFRSLNVAIAASEPGDVVEALAGGEYESIVLD